MSDDPQAFRRTLEDRVRDRLLGRLSPAASAALSEELAADPESARRAMDYEEAHRLTAPLERDDARSRSTWADLRLERRRIAPRTAVLAAAALALAAVGLSLLLRRAAPEPVALAAVPRAPLLLGAAADRDLLAAPLVPPSLLPYRSTDAKGVRWLGDETAARALARWTGRPVFSFGMIPGCPYCRHMEVGPLRAPAVLERMDGYVPLELDLSGRDPDELRRILSDGWPRFRIEDADGAVLERFDGMWEAPDVLRRLETPRAAAAPVAWAVANRWLETVERARVALVDRRYGDAWVALDAARAVDGARERPAWQDALDRMARHVTAAAAEALATARAASDPASLLEASARRFLGSPYAPDFQRLAARVRADGTFPPLVEDPR